MINELPKRNYLALSVVMITCLSLLINVSFKIIFIKDLMFTASSLLCPFIAGLYLLMLREYSLQQQRHFLNQALLTLYLFPLGVFFLVNLPASALMNNNIVYLIVFDDIPKKFFAATIAFGLSFYLPHIFYCSKRNRMLAPQKTHFCLALLGGICFFSVDFIILYTAPLARNFAKIYLGSLLILTLVNGLIGLIYLGYNYSFPRFKNLFVSKVDRFYLRLPHYHYLISLAIIITLICLTCEYRLVDLGHNWALVASGILFPLTVTISSLMEEVYGYQANRRLIFILIMSELIFDGLLMAIIRLPSPEFFDLNPYYLFIMPRRIPAAILAIVVTLMSNSILLSYFKKISSKEKYRGLRLFTANFIAISLLALVNYSLLFQNIYSEEQILNLVINGWIYKLIIMILILPLTLKLYNFFNNSLQPYLYDKQAGN